LAKHKTAYNAEFAREFVRTIQTAKKYGDVCIVTFAKRPWVHSTMACLLPPHLHNYLEVENIPVFYAREFLNEDSKEMWARSFSGCPSYRDMRRNEILIGQKNAAMMHVLNKGKPLKSKSMHAVPSSSSVSTMASEAQDMPYSHVVAIGDGDCEMIAAHDLALRCSQSLVTKTVKLVAKPSLADVISNLTTIADDFGALAAHERDAHIVVHDYGSLKTLLDAPESQNISVMYERLFQVNHAP
jgi:hypothetical protein